LWIKISYCNGLKQNDVFIIIVKKFINLFPLLVVPY